MQQLEDVLTTNPSAQFQATATALGSAASASERMADAVERAAAASGRIRPFSAGGVAHFANGGRGTDTIPAMLTAGESVINAKSSRRSFSQIQAMNAGHTPVFRENGGSVDNSVNVGDVTLTGEQAASVRDVMRSFARERRRGSGK